VRLELSVLGLWREGRDGSVLGDLDSGFDDRLVEVVRIFCLW